MNAAIRQKIMGLEDFLAWEVRQEFKYEFDGFEPVPMTGGTVNHALVQTNLALAVASRLRGSTCIFLGSDMKLAPANRSRYPDGQVACGLADGTATFTTTPTVVFEVVSPGSEETDHAEKLADHQAVACIQQYVLVEQDRPLATVHTRGPGGRTTATLEPGAVIDMPAISQQVPLAEFYVGVAFPAA